MKALLAFAVCVWCSSLVASKAVDRHNVGQDEDVHSVEKRASSVCYNRIGCFALGSPWFSSQRPLNLLPVPPDKLLTKFMLYTRESRTKESILDARHPDTFSTAWPNYKASRPTKIICHGFLDSVLITPWMKEMKDELLTHGDYNTIITDWHHGNLPPYTQATGNTRLVGAQMADLIKTIMTQTGQSASDFHIIGHSLGAHIGGYAGQRIPGLGRITGMDPAGPYFEDTDPEVRLDKTDAVFVDNIHSDAEDILHLGLGMRQPIGHADYYPNKGHDQPGCDADPVTQIVDNGVFQGAQEFVACNHLRSWKFFTESINTQCPFLAFPCNNEDDFANGKCYDCGPQGCGYMGMAADRHVPETPTNYYLTTADHAPFCQYHYQVSVKLDSGSSRERGLMKARLTGNQGSSGWVTLNSSPKDFTSGATYTYSFGVPSNVGHITAVDFSWEHQFSITDPLKWNPLGLRHPTIKVDEIEFKHLEFGDSTKFCQTRITPLETDKVLHLSSVC